MPFYVTSVVLVSYRKGREPTLFSIRFNQIFWIPSSWTWNLFLIKFFKILLRTIQLVIAKSLCKENQLLIYNIYIHLSERNQRLHTLHFKKNCLKLVNEKTHLWWCKLDTDSCTRNVMFNFTVTFFKAF